MTEIVVKAVPVPDLRDGEPLEMAIADAERKARLSREQANTSIALAEKWEGVAERLRGARELARLPAAPAPVMQGSRRKASDRKPHGFWFDKVEEVINGFVKQHGHGPTKRTVIRMVLEAHPLTPKTSVYHGLNTAIDDGRIRFRGPDCLYMPADDPERCTFTGCGKVRIKERLFCGDHVPQLAASA